MDPPPQSAASGAKDAKAMPQRRRHRTRIQCWRPGKEQQHQVDTQPKSASGDQSISSWSYPPARLTFTMVSVGPR